MKSEEYTVNRENCNYIKHLSIYRRKIQVLNA